MPLIGNILYYALRMPKLRTITPNVNRHLEISFSDQSMCKMSLLVEKLNYTSIDDKIITD